MRVSVCLTVLNAEKLISPLLESLLNQTKRAEEIVIVDGGSSDRTVEIISHFQKKERRIKLLKQKCLRAQGRNLSIELSRNSIVAMTDAGCIAKKDWLEKITAPLIHNEVDIASGVYKMKGDSPMQKALGIFLGFPLSKFSEDFLPTTRSIAFRKESWEKVGGFPEGKGNSAEDTEFNYKAIKLGLKYSRVKDAVVEWGIPETLAEGLKTMGDYARWDAAYGIWRHPTQGFASHNIKVILIFLRYLAGSVLLLFSLKTSLLFYLLILGFVGYLSWAFRKVYLEYGNWKVAVWGPIIQVLSDFVVMGGFIKGVAGRDETHLG
jgi:glycosyltransferase involved in cell wall biosynthesis